MEDHGGPADDKVEPTQGETDNDTLKYQLLGPSLTKAGQDAVDQQKVCLMFEIPGVTSLLRSLIGV